MSDTFRLSHRAVAVSACALLLTGASVAPALADGKDGKGGKGSHGSQQGGKHGAKPSAKPAGKPEGSKGSGGKGSGGSGDPAGNNGTFKVDGLPYSDGMANEPHVSCGFRLKFFGFDAGQTGDITIAGHAPSGSGVVNKKTGVTISDDAAGGGPNDPDAIFTYSASDLDLAGLTAHPKQGYHLKVTLNTDTPGGVKHKVFWYEPCAPVVAPGGTETGDTETGDTETGDTETGGTDTETGGTGGTGGVIAPTTDTQARTEVLGTRFDRVDTSAPASRTAGTGTGARVLGTKTTRTGPLAFTGSFTYGLLALGGALVAAGGLVLAATRRRRVRPTA
jgi:hypothetical protein